MVLKIDSMSIHRSKLNIKKNIVLLNIKNRYKLLTLYRYDEIV